MILSHKRFSLSLLLTGTAISLVGDTLAQLAVPWYVLVTTGSATRAGLTAFSSAIPAVLSAFLGGAIIDRLGHRKAIILADLVSGIAIALIPLLHLMGVLAYWQLLVLVFMSSLLGPPGNAARQAIIPDLAVLSSTRLERANGAYVTIQSASQCIGAPLAGLLIVALGPGNALWLDAASFGISMSLAVLFVPVLITSNRALTDGKRQHYRVELLAGLRFVLGEKSIRMMVLAGTALNFLSFPLLGVVLPVLVQRTFGNAVYLGLLLTVYSGGTIAGGMLYSALAHRLPRHPLLILEALGPALGVVILAVHPPLALMCGALLLAGLAAGPGPVIVTTLFQERTPVHIRGNVLSAVIAFSIAAVPPGMLLAGLALDTLDFSVTLFVIAAGFALIGLVLLRSSILRDI